MNLLDNYTLLNDTFKPLSETVLINGKPRQAIIGMAYLGVAENRHINTLEPIKRGDYVEHKGHIYIVSEEVKTPRQNKYRATMTSCNITIEARELIERVKVGTGGMGRPIYQNIYSDPYYIEGAMKQWERSLDDAFAIAMMDVSFFVDIQDNPKNREQFKINNIYKIKGMDVAVNLQDLSQDGLLGLLFVKTGKEAPY